MLAVIETKLYKLKIVISWKLYNSKYQDSGIIEAPMNLNFYWIWFYGVVETFRSRISEEYHSVHQISIVVTFFLKLKSQA